MNQDKPDMKSIPGAHRRVAAFLFGLLLIAHPVVQRASAADSRPEFSRSSMAGIHDIQKDQDVDSLPEHDLHSDQGDMFFLPHLLPILFPSVRTTQSMSAWAWFLLLAAATLISEDLTCIAAGVLVAQGQLGFGLTASACLAGIYAGDLLLFLAGRLFGLVAIKRAPLRWFLSQTDIERSAAWFSRRGAWVIAISRLIPGTRLPSYFAAGLLKMNFWRYAAYFLAAAAAWTPLLVGASALLGGEVLESALLAQKTLVFRLLAGTLMLFGIVKVAVALSTFQGRRLLLSRWRRISRWEFWPPWAFYPPVVLYVLWLAVKHRGLAVFSAANPSIPGGGFIGESKSDILDALPAESVAPFVHISRPLPAATRIQRAKAFMTGLGLGYPIVLKPDVGQRGTGVAIVHSEVELVEILSRAQEDMLIQEYVPGSEFGVFYYRLPDSDRGHILSITEKRFPFVVGDGVSTLEQLILRDPRAVCMARFHLNHQKRHLNEVLAAGMSQSLVELGSHCRGSLFLDGEWANTVALESAIDQIAKQFAGFYFGRFDIRTRSVTDFRQGKNFKVIELNGVTSEATNIYDPRNSLLTAYTILFRQWQLAFQIGALNRDRGYRPAPLLELLRMVVNYQNRSKSPSEARLAKLPQADQV